MNVDTSSFARPDNHRSQIDARAKVRDRTSSPVITVGVDATCGDVERILETHAISAVPVEDADGRLVGIVSSTDLLAKPAGTFRVASEVMSSPVIVAGPDEDIDEVAWRMVAARVHRVVVVGTDERVIGILSARDVLQEVIGRRLEEPIGRVMRAPVESIAIGDSIDDALVRLASANVHGLVVMDGTMPVGAFTHAEALASRRLPPALRSRPVEEMMSYQTLCLDRSTPIRRAAAYAAAMNARRILVVRDAELVGILSCLDLVSVLTRA